MMAASLLWAIWLSRFCRGMIALGSRRLHCFGGAILDFDYCVIYALLLVFLSSSRQNGHREPARCLPIWSAAAIDVVQLPREDRLRSIRSAPGWVETLPDRLDTIE
ncbi:hypothetical protein BJX96DRAFT_156039 [Aspergillus floccosus]